MHHLTPFITDTTEPNSQQLHVQSLSPAQTQELDTSRSHFELLTVSAGAATGADTAIGYISKPLRVVNGQSVGPAAVCGGRQRTQTEELGTSRSHFELLTVSAGAATGADRGIGYISKPPLLW